CRTPAHPRLTPSTLHAQRLHPREIHRWIRDQDVLGEPEWAGLLTPADRRGLTPLFWSHVRPYGEVNLDMCTRLNLTSASAPGARASADNAERSTAGNE
ncbi:hypothetical protein, partial [Streptomyces sp. NPDC057910]|uniref:hypothetical protein n=1 Tax=Streptomyces sp. NPDC057910 TaxID=3346278 RepID=UPI0036EBE7BB